MSEERAQYEYRGDILRGKRDFTPKERLAARLLEMPTQIREAERALVITERALQGAVAALQDREDRLMLDEESPINRRNAEVRAAQIREFTARERAGVAEQEALVDTARLRLHFAHNEFSSLRAVACLMAGGEEER